MIIFVTTYFMIRTEKSIEINCSKNNAQDFLFNLNNIPFWQKEIKRVEWKTPPPAKAGTEITLVPRFSGNKIKHNYVVLELSSDVLSIKRYDRYVTLETIIRLNEINSHKTEVTIEYIAGKYGIPKFLWPYVRFLSGIEARRRLKKIKKVVEKNMVKEIV